MGQPLLSYPLSSNGHVDAGIRQEIQAGFVAEYECREAARFVLETWSNWLDLDTESRAKAVAHYRLSHAIESNVVDAHSIAAERQARRTRRR